MLMMLLIIIMITKVIMLLMITMGLAVKASASGAEDPGFESRLLRDFFRPESYQ